MSRQWNAIIVIGVLLLAAILWLRGGTDDADGGNADTVIDADFLLL